MRVPGLLTQRLSYLYPVIDTDVSAAFQEEHVKPQGNALSCHKEYSKTKRITGNTFLAINDM